MAGLELAQITMKQVFILFILIGAGFACVKAGGVKPEARKHFSAFLVNIVVPCMIINSYMQEFDPNVLKDLGVVVLFATIFTLVGAGITFLTTGWLKKDIRSILRFACIFPNAGYMGFPLIEALFGKLGLLYASAYVTVFNIFLWTLGYVIVCKETSKKKVVESVVKNPALISVVIGLAIYLLRIPVPEVIQSPISNLGAINTPLSMFITGMIIANSNIPRIVKNWSIQAVVAIHMFLIPAVSVLIAWLLHVNGLAIEVVLLLHSCPCAAITAVFAVQYGYDEETGAGTVVLSTLLSTITLPLMALIIETVL